MRSNGQIILLPPILFTTDCSSETSVNPRQAAGNSGISNVRSMNVSGIRGPLARKERGLHRVHLGYYLTRRLPQMNKFRTVVFLDPKQKAALDKLCKSTGSSRGELIRQAINAFLRRKS